ncbi:MAG: response regulator [Candidatus Methylomirabilales bacterium]
MQPNYTVMIIEDNRLLREQYRDLLDAEGFSVAEASNGAEGLICLLGETADVIVLDVEMPVMDGRSFLEYRYRHAKIRDIPVVVVSSRLDDVGLRHTLLRLGADRLFHQPFNHEEFLGTVRGLLAKPRFPVGPPPEARYVGVREDARLSFTVPMRIRTGSSGETPGMLRDLSAGGLGAHLHHRLHEWEPITIGLTVAGHSLALRGYVQWFAKNRASMSYRYGIQFTERQHDSFPLHAYAFFREHLPASRFNAWSLLSERRRRRAGRRPA